jgi:preprotein translocase subunit SecD
VSRVAPRARKVATRGIPLLVGALALTSCTTVDHTSTAASVEPVPTESPAAVLDIQLRGVLDVANAEAGQCPQPAVAGSAAPSPTPTTPPASSQATLCSADRTLVYTLAPAAVPGEQVSDIAAVSNAGSPAVQITVTPQGGAALSRLSATAMVASPPRSQIAIVSHGLVQVALPVTEQIDGRVLDVNGFDSQDAAQQAVDLLTS